MLTSLSIAFRKKVNLRLCPVLIKMVTRCHNVHRCLLHAVRQLIFIQFSKTTGIKVTKKVVTQFQFEKSSSPRQNPYTSILFIVVVFQWVYQLIMRVWFKINVFRLTIFFCKLWKQFNRWLYISTANMTGTKFIQYVAFWAASMCTRIKNQEWFFDFDTNFTFKSCSRIIFRKLQVP